MHNTAVSVESEMRSPIRCHPTNMWSGALLRQRKVKSSILLQFKGRMFRQ